jgi:hypothetical protein
MLHMSGIPGSKEHTVRRSSFASTRSVLAAPLGGLARLVPGSPMLRFADASWSFSCQLSQTGTR